MQSPDWLAASGGLIPLLTGIVVIFFGKRRLNWARPSWLFAIFLCVFGVLCAFLVWGSVADAYNSEALAVFESGNYSVLDGVVHDFQPMPYDGHAEGCFSLRSQRFCYSDYVPSPGFHNAASHGGLFAPGFPHASHTRAPSFSVSTLARTRYSNPSESRAAVDAVRRQSEIITENNAAQQRLATASLFTIVCWTLWWNLQWKRAIRFWLRSPNRPVIQNGFRIFFGLNLMGGLIALIRQLHTHPMTRQNAGATLAAAGIMCCGVGSMTAFGLWSIARHDR
jgi:hypothetical protein